MESLLDFDYEEDLKEGVGGSGAGSSKQVFIRKSIKVWSTDDTEELFEKYNEYIECIGPLKQFKNKKQMWMEIAKELNETGDNNWSPSQCEQRFKTVLRRKKQSTLLNYNGESKKIKIVYKNKLRKTKAADTPSVGNIKHSRNYKNVKDSYIEFLIEKEKNCERRHREKMQMTEKMHKLLEKLLHKK